MDNKVLEQAIHKAIDNGWKMVTPDDETRIKNEDPFKDVIEYWDLDWRDDEDSYYHIIFNHDFAKALWGEEKWYFTENCEWLPESNPDKSQYLIEMEAWQYHLQQMVIADDPIEYLGDNI